MQYLLWDSDDKYLWYYVGGFLYGHRIIIEMANKWRKMGIIC